MTDVAARTPMSACFEACSAGAPGAMRACVIEDVKHRVTRGALRHGKGAFAAFYSHMGRSYRERLEDRVIRVAENGRRAASAFTMRGDDVATDPRLPKPRGQRHGLPAGSSCTLRAGQVARITTRCTPEDRIAQVSR